jgi:hypothetical protein
MIGMMCKATATEYASSFTKKKNFLLNDDGWASGVALQISSQASFSE